MDIRIIYDLRRYFVELKNFANPLSNRCTDPIYDHEIEMLKDFFKADDGYDSKFYVAIQDFFNSDNETSYILNLRFLLDFIRCSLNDEDMKPKIVNLHRILFGFIDTKTSYDEILNRVW